MRLRLAVPASLLATLVAAAVPAVVSAAPQHNHNLTINATPNPIVSGDAVLIYGQLNIKHHGNRLIVLYHRVDAKHFTVVQTTRTTATGFYDFTRAEDVVTTNRSWYVTGPNGSHSRTVHERVAAAVGTPTVSGHPITNHVLTFTGHVSPDNAGHRVFLQAQMGLKGDDWVDIGSARLGPGSNYSIKHKFLVPGERDLRVRFAGDRHDGDNTSAVSDSVTVSIQQTQNPKFTIMTSSQIIKEGGSVTISGRLLSAPNAGQMVQLYGHQADTRYAAIGAPQATLADGSYSFTATPIHNEVYQVRTVPGRSDIAIRRTAQLFEGVQDVLTLNPVSPHSVVGAKVTFSGTVTPNKAGHVIDLQRLGKDGDWHVVKESRVAAGSTYSINWTFGSPGSKTFRVRIPGGEFNVGAVSAPQTILVTLPPVVSSLPAAA